MPPPGLRPSDSGISPTASAEGKSEHFYDYEQKYEDDPYGEEVNGNARVWRVLLAEAREFDTTTVRSWRETLDVYLVFTGLFSAVVTTLVVQSSQSLQPDQAEISVTLLRELLNVQKSLANDLPVDLPTQYADNVPTASNVKYWTNRSWFLSLALSLFAALMAVLIRQWLQEYERAVSGTAKDRALTWQYRRSAMKHWKIPLMVALLPMLLHLALFMFFIGLILFIIDYDRPMAWVIVALTGFFYSLYALSTILPMTYPQCPYRTPASHYGYLLVQLLFACARPRGSQTPSRNLHSSLDASTPGAREHADVSSRKLELMATSLVWAFKSSSNLSVTAIMVQAASGLPDDLNRDSALWGYLRRYVIIWFHRAIARGVILDWKAGQEWKFGRLACCLLRSANSTDIRDILKDEEPYFDFDLDPESTSDTETKVYQDCVLRVLVSLTAAIRAKGRNAPGDPDMPMLEAAALALSSQLPSMTKPLTRVFSFLFPERPYSPSDPRYRGENVFWRCSALAGPNPPLNLRLHPSLWIYMLRYLATLAGNHASRSCLHFALFLWRSMDPTAPIRRGDKKPPKSVVTLRWLCTAEGQGRVRWLAQRTIQNLLCLYVSCDTYKERLGSVDPDNATDDKAVWLHMSRHALTDYDQQTDETKQFADVEPDVRDRNVGLLAKNFACFLDGQPDIFDAEHLVGADKAITRFHLEKVETSRLLSRAYRRALEEGVEVPATTRVQLFRLLVKLLSATLSNGPPPARDTQVDTLWAMARLCNSYPREVNEGVKKETDFQMLLRPLINTCLYDPLANTVAPLSSILGSSIYIDNIVRSSGVAGQQAMQHNAQQSQYIVLCAWFDMLCAARPADQLGPAEVGIAQELHDALRSLIRLPSLGDAREVWRRDILNCLTAPIPLALGMALNDPRGSDVFAELVLLLANEDPAPAPARRAARQDLQNAFVEVEMDVTNNGQDMWRLCIADDQPIEGNTVLISRLVSIQLYSQRVQAMLEGQRREQEQENSCP